MKELREVFEDLDVLLKNPEVGAALTERGVNVSLAIVAAEEIGRASCRERVCYAV